MSKKKINPAYPHLVKSYGIGVNKYEVQVEDSNGLKRYYGLDNREIGGIIYVAGEFAHTGLYFEFSVNGEEWHEHDFGDVIKCLLEYPEAFSIEGYEDDYSRQEIEMLAAVRKRALEVKREENADV